jgi:hypothetical protein
MPDKGILGGLKSLIKIYLRTSGACCVIFAPGKDEALRGKKVGDSGRMTMTLKVGSITNRDWLQLGV